MIHRIKQIVSIKLILLLVLVINNEQSIAQSKNTNLKKLTESSEIILLGKVSNTKSDWNEQKDRIFTRVIITADEYIKGTKSSDDIVITIPGGEVGDIGELYSHMPKFDLKEEVLLFLKRDNQNNHIVNNGIEGKYSIKKDNKAGIKINGKVNTVENVIANIKSIIRKN